MVLSKDDITEKPKTPEITASRKRRERRKKLHAAKEKLLNSGLKRDTETISGELNVVNKPIEQTHQNSNDKAPCKGQKFTCPILDKSQKTKEPALVNNNKSQESQSNNQKEQKSISETKSSKAKSTVENEKNKCKCDHPNKKQKSKNQNLIPTEFSNTKSENQVLSEDKNINSEDSVLIQNQIIKKETPASPAKQIEKPDRIVLSEIQTAQYKKQTLTDNLITNTSKVGSKENQTSQDFNSVKNETQKPQPKKLNEKQELRPVNSLNQNEESKLDNISALNKNKSKLETITTILDYKSGAEYNISVVDQKTKSEESNIINNLISTPEEIKPENQVSESQNSNSLSEKLISSNKEMGKSHDSELSKSQSESTKCSKSGDVAPNDASAKSREEIKAAREAKKLAKLKAKKKGDDTVDNVMVIKEDKSPKASTKTPVAKENITQKVVESGNKSEKIIRSETKGVSMSKSTPSTRETKVEGKVPVKHKENVEIETSAVKTEESGKSKAELRAERRAKQEAQRAAKQAATQAKVSQPTKPEAKQEPIKNTEEKTVEKTKPVVKSKPKAQSVQKVGWFQHLPSGDNKEFLKNIPVNSNLHPAVIKLGVQLASHVVSGSNARCIALLNALKQMVRDYTLPARTEFGRGLEAQLAASVAFLAATRQPTASETNALKHFRRHLTQLPNNVDEFDAKKKLQEEIDRYIREQIDMAGEAISIIVRKKISNGDNILTYGCSSLIERILCEAWAAGVRFRALVAGGRPSRAAHRMLRRLLARGVPASYVDFSALSYVMKDVQKVVVGAGALLANGAALGAAGGAAVALLARAANVPLLVAAETHKFTERVQTDAFLYNEIGDPDDLIDKTDENSPLKDWRSNPNLTLLNPIYDVTPPSLITAVVTELGILPCTSAPVVLRFKQSEWGM